MTRDDIIRMAEKAGFSAYHLAVLDQGIYRFADSVAAAERERVAAEMTDAANEAVRCAMEFEREACAKIAESYEPRCDVCPSGVANAIRKRGEQ